MHINLLETTPENQALLLAGLDYLIMISYVEESEVFKTCLDYWNYLVPDIYSSVCAGIDPNAFSFTAQPPAAHVRKVLYQATLSKLRQLMICRMAKPEEVRRVRCVYEWLGVGSMFAHSCGSRLPCVQGAKHEAWLMQHGGTAQHTEWEPLLHSNILPRATPFLHTQLTMPAHTKPPSPPSPSQVIVVEDENGNIVRETMKDNDVLAQYRSMRETLIYLSHLDHEDTENQMLEKLRQQMVAQLQVRWGRAGSMQ